MNDKRPKRRSDENYVKPSKHKQWRERTEKPIAAKPMSSDEIFETQANFAASYQCELSDIKFDFVKILDENDEDRDDCLWLKYKMRCIHQGVPTMREIFSLKILIPEEIKRAAENVGRSSGARNRRGRRGATAKCEEPKVMQIEAAPQEQAAPRPRLNKPKLIPRARNC